MGTLSWGPASQGHSQRLDVCVGRGLQGACPAHSTPRHRSSAFLPQHRRSCGGPERVVFQLLKNRAEMMSVFTDHSLPQSQE